MKIANVLLSADAETVDLEDQTQESGRVAICGLTKHLEVRMYSI